MRSTKRTDRSASAGSGEDQTRQAVPTPSRSVTWTSARLLAVGKTPMEVGWDQALPDWLKHTCNPQLSPEGVPAVAVGISRATGEPGTSGTLQRVLGFRRVDAGDPGRGQRLDGPGPAAETDRDLIPRPRAVRHRRRSRPTCGPGNS